MADPRLEVVERVRRALEEDARIEGLVLIGSGAEGFRDELSDVDLIAAVAEPGDALAVGDECAARLREILPLYRYVQTRNVRERGIHVFLLDGHLELDLSFIATGELRATEPRWRLLFASPQEAEQYHFLFLAQ